MKAGVDDPGESGARTPALVVVDVDVLDVVEVVTTVVAVVADELVGTALGCIATAGANPLEAGAVVGGTTIVVGAAVIAGLGATADPSVNLVVEVGIGGLVASAVVVLVA